MAYALTDFCETLRLCRGALRWYRACGRRREDRRRHSQFLVHRHPAWAEDPANLDDFIPPASGPGPVMSDPAHPYVPNGNGRQPTYRIADLTNPILKPWVIEKMKKANDDVMAGKVPYIARERCWPAGVPGLDVYTRGQPIYFIQTPKEVLMVNEL